MADSQDKPTLTFLQACQTFLDEISTGQRRTTMSHGELMLVATYVGQLSGVTVVSETSHEERRSTESSPVAGS